MNCLSEPLTSSGIRSASTNLYMLLVIVAQVINAIAMQQNVLRTFSAVFDFLSVCVIKYSFAALVKHNFEFSIDKYQNQSKSTASGQTDTTNGQTSTTNGQTITTSGQNNTMSG